MGLLSTGRNLASLWAETKKIELQQKGKPDTRVDSGGSKGQYSFDGQQITRDDLRDIRDMRESGGIIAHLVHAKAVMQFGTGASFQAEDDEASEWLHEQFADLDNLLIELGEDATWFPYSPAELVETRGGDFSHVECVEPWTMLPVENEYGEVVAWEQQISGDYGQSAEVFEPEEVATFILNKNSGRDKTGVSEVLRAEDEVRSFKENQQTIQEALEYLVPHLHVKVGREGGTVMDDNELRRVRTKFDDLKGDTVIVSGRDVDSDEISLSQIDVKEITNNDLRQVCVALGVPIELGSVISEGLGSGEQSSVREQFFQLEKSAKQRALGGQFVEQVARPLLEQYSPYDADQQLDLVFEEADSIEEKKTTIDAIGDALTNNEKRQMFDYAELDDEEKGEAFDSPGEGSEDSGGMGGLFAEEGGTGNRCLEEAPEWDAHLLDLHSRVWDADADKALFSITEGQTPEFVKDRIRDAIDGGALFSQFEDVPSSKLMELRSLFKDELTEDGWSLNSLRDELMEFEPSLSKDQAETIARTETSAVLNKSREIGYEERGDGEGEVFYWSGALDGRHTEACEWLIEETNPAKGGEPVSLEELRSMVKEAPEHDDDMPSNLSRPDDWVPHPNCRKTFVRAVEGAFE